MQEQIRQRGSSRSADLRRLYEEVFKSKKSSDDEFYGEYDNINDDDDADCCMD